MAANSQTEHLVEPRRRGRPAGLVPFYEQETRFSVALYFVLIGDLKFAREKAAEFAVSYFPKITEKQRKAERRQRKEDRKHQASQPAPKSLIPLSEIEYLRISSETTVISQMSRQPSTAGAHLIRKANAIDLEIGNCPRSREWLYWSQMGLRLLLAAAMTNNPVIATKAIRILRSLGWKQHLKMLSAAIVGGRDFDLRHSADGDRYRNTFEKLNRKALRRQKESRSTRAA